MRGAGPGEVRFFLLLLGAFLAGLLTTLASAPLLAHLR
jgi:hypothetical protein